METTVVSKTTSKGQSLEIRVADGLIAVYLDGKLIGKVSSVIALGNPKMLGQAKITHYLATSPAPIGLTSAEAKQVESARAASYQPKPRSLREQRRELALEVKVAIDESDSRFNRAHAREDAAAWTIKAEWDAKVDAARAKLTAFDAQHPEVLAAIKAERKAEAERHTWD